MGQHVLVPTPQNDVRSSRQVRPSPVTAIGTSAGPRGARIGRQSILALQASAGNRAAVAAQAAWRGPRIASPTLRGARVRASVVAPADRRGRRMSGRPRWAGSFDGPSRPGRIVLALRQRVAVSGGCSRAKHSLPPASSASRCSRRAWRTSRGWGRVARHRRASPGQQGAAGAVGAARSFDLGGTGPAGNGVDGVPRSEDRGGRVGVQGGRAPRVRGVRRRRPWHHATAQRAIPRRRAHTDATSTLAAADHSGRSKA